MNIEEAFYLITAVWLLPLYIVPLLIICEFIGFVLAGSIFVVIVCSKDYIELMPYRLKKNRREKILKRIACCLDDNNIEKAYKIYFNQNDDILHRIIINDFPLLATQYIYDKDKNWDTRWSMISANPSLATQENYDKENKLLSNYVENYKIVYILKNAMLMKNNLLATQENYDKEKCEKIKQKMIELNKNIIY